MRPVGHLTPAYIGNRLMAMYWEKRHPTAPWMTREAVQILDGWLKPEDIGLEFGSGRSTLWFAARMARLTSVESNPGWYAKVRESLAQGDGRVQLLLFEDGESGSGDSSYVRVVDDFADSSLDLVVVDGTARDHCAVAALGKVRPGGILVFDDAHRYIPRAGKSGSPGARGPADGYASPVWQRVGDELASWRCIWTSDGVKDTALFFRPC